MSVLHCGGRLVFNAPLRKGALYDEIAVVETLTRTLVRITTDADGDCPPAWSLDGLSIAWYRNVPDKRALDGT